MIDQPARSSASTNAANKGSNVSTFSGAPPSPEQSEDVSMEASVDKRSRESSDTATKSDGKSLKTSEAASPSSVGHDTSESRDIDTHVSDVSAGQEANSKPSANRRLANDASEARF